MHVNSISVTSLPNKKRMQRLHEMVREHILQQIKDGELVPGDKLLAERELAASLGVARLAVREAVRSLEMSGVLRVELGVRGGAFVCETGSDGIAFSIRNMLILGRLPLTDLLEVRASLLGQSARLGTKRGTAADFDLIEKNIDFLETQVDHESQLVTISPATDFYRLAARASHNPLMALFVDAMADIVKEMLTALGEWPRTDGITPRRQMLAAMRAGQEDEAERVIRMHCEETNALLMDYEAKL